MVVGSGGDDLGKRLIYAEDMIEEMVKFGRWDTKTLEALNRIPSVDAVPVVRCKDCKYGYKALKSPFVFCGKPYSGYIAHETDYYCADGKRR